MYNAILFLLLYIIKKPNKILLKCLTSVFTKTFFAEECMHGSNDDDFFKMLIINQ